MESAMPAGGGLGAVEAFQPQRWVVEVPQSHDMSKDAVLLALQEAEDMGPYVELVLVAVLPNPTGQDVVSGAWESELRRVEEAVLRPFCVLASTKDVKARTHVEMSEQHHKGLCDAVVRFAAPRLYLNTRKHFSLRRTSGAAVSYMEAHLPAGVSIVVVKSGKKVSETRVIGDHMGKSISARALRSVQSASPSALLQAMSDPSTGRSQGLAPREPSRSAATQAALRQRSDASESMSSDSGSHSTVPSLPGHGHDQNGAIGEDFRMLSIRSIHGSFVERGEAQTEWVRQHSLPSHVFEGQLLPGIWQDRASRFVGDSLSLSSSSPTHSRVTLPSDLDGSSSLHSGGGTSEFGPGDPGPAYMGRPTEGTVLPAGRQFEPIITYHDSARTSSSAGSDSVNPDSGAAQQPAMPVAHGSLLSSSRGYLARIGSSRKKANEGHVPGFMGDGGSSSSSSRFSTVDSLTRSGHWAAWEGPGAGGAGEGFPSGSLDATNVSMPYAQNATEPTAEAMRGAVPYMQDRGRYAAGMGGPLPMEPGLGHMAADTAALLEEIARLKASTAAAQHAAMAAEQDARKARDEAMRIRIRGRQGSWQEREQAVPYQLMHAAGAEQPSWNGPGLPTAGLASASSCDHGRGPWRGGAGQANGAPSSASPQILMHSLKEDLERSLMDCPDVNGSVHSRNEAPAWDSAEDNGLIGGGLPSTAEGSGNSVQLGKGSTDSMPRPSFSSDSDRSQGGAHECRHFTVAQLQIATNNYSEDNFIGRGSYGPVYRGQLLGCAVAVKKLEGKGDQGDTEFRTEVDVLSRVRHPNIVLLMGHCPETHCLVYEFLSGGSLQDRLHPGGMEAAKPGMPPAGASTGEKRVPPLLWHERFRIASEIASALLFLHRYDPPIMHRDLKPDNILLDANDTSKISDVGLARLVPEEHCEVTVRVMGTAGYIDPETLTIGEMSIKSDYYAFGLIVLQLFTGLKTPKQILALLHDCCSPDSTDMDPSRDRAKAVGLLLQNLDPSAGSWPRDLAAPVLGLAVGCIERQGARRPDLETEILPCFMEAAKEARDLRSSRMQAAQARFMCPLSKERMKDPVVAADGFTYERAHIEQWLTTSDASPCTGEVLAHKALAPNNALKDLINASV